MVREVFGDRHEAVQRYVDLLATAGTDRGLVGPRERDRLWERHVLDCVALARWCPEGGHVIDVGSGAGLPGVVLALARPDLSLTLVEPMQRRVTWLHEVVDDLGIAARPAGGIPAPGVRVVRARAEECGLTAGTVTARAVAPLDRLAGWCLPLVEPGGQLLAMKGRSAHEELAAAVPQLRRLRADSWEVLTADPPAAGGERLVPTTVVRVTVTPRRGAPPRTPARSR